MEDVSLSRAERAEARLDVAVGLPGLPIVYLDAAIVDAFSVTAAAEEARRRHRGEAASAAEDRKRSKYHHAVGSISDTPASHRRAAPRATRPRARSTGPGSGGCSRAHSEAGAARAPAPGGPAGSRKFPRRVPCQRHAGCHALGVRERSARFV